MKQLYSLLMFALLLPLQAEAVEIEGVSVPESVQVENSTLQLNDAGGSNKVLLRYLCHCPLPRAEE